MEKRQKWLGYKSDRYKEKSPLWRYAIDHYNADFHNLRTPKYLIQRFSGEDTLQFQERMKIADYQPLFGLVADTYIGRILEAEARFSRVWGDFGDVNDPASIAYRLWTNIDGLGTDLLTMIEEVGSDAMTCQEAWGIAEGRVLGEDGQVIREPYIRLIKPLQVHDEYDQDGVLQWVKIHFEHQEPRTARQEAKKEERWRIYDMTGWEEWARMKDENGQEEDVNTVPYRPYSDDASGEPFVFYDGPQMRSTILPVFRVELPIKRMLGAMLAHKNNVIFNQESERDNLLRVANTPKAQFVGDYKAFSVLLKDNNAGGNIWQLDPAASKEHKFMAPPIESAKIATDVLKAKVEHFFLSAFRYYEDSIKGSQKTATEITQDAAGENSFLGILATFLDQFEQKAFMRLAQIEFPNSPEKWGTIKIERKKDFKPVDERTEADRILQRYFGAQVTPVLTRDAEIEITKRAYEQDGIEAEEAEIIREIDARRGEEEIRRQQLSIQRDRDQVLAEMDGQFAAQRRIEIEEAAANAAGV